MSPPDGFEAEFKRALIEGHSAHTFSTAEEAFHALQNAGQEIAAFARKLAPILDDLGRIQCGKANGKSEAEWIEQILREHIADQYPDAITASREHFEDDPMKEKAA